MNYKKNNHFFDRINERYMAMKEQTLLFSIAINDDEGKITFAITKGDEVTQFDVDLSNINENNNKYVPVNIYDGKYLCTKKDGKCHVCVYDEQENEIASINDQFINGRYYAFFKTGAEIIFKKGEQVEFEGTTFLESDNEPLENVSAEEKLVTGFVEISGKEGALVHIYDVTNGNIKSPELVKLECPGKISYVKTDIIGMDPEICFVRNESGELQMVTEYGNLSFYSFFGKVSKILDIKEYLVHKEGVDLTATPVFNSPSKGFNFSAYSSSAKTTKTQSLGADIYQSSTPTRSVRSSTKNPLIESMIKEVEEKFVSPRKENKKDISGTMLTLDVKLNRKDAIISLRGEDTGKKVDLSNLREDNIVICNSDILDITIMFTRYQGEISAHILKDINREDIHGEGGAFHFMAKRGNAKITAENLFKIHWQDIVKSPVKKPSGNIEKEEQIELVESFDPKQLQDFIKLFVGEDITTNKTGHRGRIKAIKAADTEAVRQEFTKALTEDLTKLMKEKPDFAKFIMEHQDKHDKFVSGVIRDISEHKLFHKHAKFHYCGFSGNIIKSLVEFIYGLFSRETWNDWWAGRTEMQVTDSEAFKKDLAERKDLFDKAFENIAAQTQEKQVVGK